MYIYIRTDIHTYIYPARPAGGIPATAKTFDMAGDDGGSGGGGHGGPTGGSGPT